MNRKMLIILLLLSGSRLIAGGITKEQIEPYLASHLIIVEAGAHVGTDTVEMADRWPHAKICAFEPVPSLFEALTKKTKTYRNVFRFREALSSQSGQATFYVSSGASDSSGSLLQPHEHLIYYPTVLFGSTIEVPTITLDDWAQRYRITHVDFMWLDLQGFELAMLKAVSDELLSTVKVMHIHVNLKELYKGCPLYPEVREWLENKGFRVAIEAMRSVDGDVLFVRE